MENTTDYENSIGQLMVAINNGDSITCMLKSEYEAQQAEQSTPNLPN
jgi:hypothetical protein